jgi:hypothetical protein
MVLWRSAQFRLVRRPAEVDKGQGDAAKRLFSWGVRVCARCVRGDWRVEASFSLPLNPSHRPRNFHERQPPRDAVDQVVPVHEASH